MKASWLALVVLVGCASEPGGEVTLPEVDAGATQPPAPDAAARLPPAIRYPTPDWAVGSPADHGIDGAALERAAAVAEGNGSRCLLVIRHGVLVYERYFGGADATTTHKSWSLAKSYSGTLVGIAIDRGDIRSLDDRVADYLPEWRGTDRDAITVRDLVSMTSGLEWSAFQDYVEMAVFSRDNTSFALDLAPSEPPRSKWLYHNGAVQLLEPLFRSATGMAIDGYAERHLWSRIGMAASWARDPAGHPTPYANVLATCRDHARLGYLYLRGGRWAGAQVLSQAWVAQALTPSQPFNRAYGFLFWLNGGTPAINAMNEAWPGQMVPFAPADLFAARGFGNQFIDVIPSLDLLVIRFGVDPANGGNLTDLVSDSRFGKHDDILRPLLAGVAP